MRRSSESGKKGVKEGCEHDPFCGYAHPVDIAFTTASDQFITCILMFKYIIIMHVLHIYMHIVH